MEITATSKTFGQSALRQIFSQAAAPASSDGQETPGAGQNTPFWTARAASALTAMQGSVRLGNANDLVKILDSDRSGGVTFAEIQNALQSANRPEDVHADFARIDANGDGAIDANELTSELTSRAPPPPQSQPAPPHGFAAVLSSVDQDGDAALALDEVASALETSSAELAPQFGALDADRDGKLNVAEFAAALHARWQEALSAYKPQNNRPYAVQHAEV